MFYLQARFIDSLQPALFRQMAHVTLHNHHQSGVCLAHAVLVKGLPEQHRFIFCFIMGVAGIYNQGVCFYCLMCWFT